MEYFFEQFDDRGCRSYLIGDARSDEVLLVDPSLRRMEEYTLFLDERRLSVNARHGQHQHYEGSENRFHDDSKA